ncbi:zinc finger MYM-type protein 5-like [Hydra vulgaris]|uniref:Zinc finger MYM-type protein 5-like n=1 Tax=Hydra vulgaris TaxID=6087 RepID=A0ABM4B186_HYDVU
MLQQNKNPQMDTNVQYISNTTCVSESGITDLENLESNCENSLIHQSNSQQRKTNLQAISNDNCISDSKISYSESLDQKCESDCSNISKLIVSDIGTVDKQNITQMQESFQTNFLIPNSIPRDSYNHAFPTRLRSKILPNGEICTRDWLCWSDVQQSFYCAPCFLLNKSDSKASIFSEQLGWNITRGWRKLKDRIPAHEMSVLHKQNYVKWKSASRAALRKSSIDNLLITELSTETSNWTKLLERRLNVILFLYERGLALFGSSQHIYDPDNGNFLGIIELLSKYDPILSEHVKKVYESQLNKKRLQVHYLSTRI